MATLEESVSSLSKEELEKKFINLYNKHQELTKKNYKIFEEHKKIISIYRISTKDLDFSDMNTKRRQQYLHKKYVGNPKLYNGILKLLVDTKDNNLQKFMNVLERELEEKALEKEDFFNKNKKYNE